MSSSTGNITVAGSDGTVTNASITAIISQNTSAATITLSGTFTATVQFEANPDGSGWIAINGTPISGTQTAVTSATTANSWLFNVAGIQKLRARCSAYTSGTIVVGINNALGTAQ